MSLFGFKLNSWFIPFYLPPIIKFSSLPATPDLVGGQLVQDQGSVAKTRNQIQEHHEGGICRPHIFSR